MSFKFLDSQFFSLNGNLLSNTQSKYITIALTIVSLNGMCGSYSKLNFNFGADRVFIENILRIVVMVPSQFVKEIFSHPISSI